MIMSLWVKSELHMLSADRGGRCNGNLRVQTQPLGFYFTTDLIVYSHSQTLLKLVTFSPNTALGR